MIEAGYAVYEKDPQHWNLHFHFSDEECEGRAVPFEWNKGFYFKEGFVAGGKLTIFAHFEPKDQVGPKRFRGSIGEPTSRASGRRIINTNDELEVC